MKTQKHWQHIIQSISNNTNKNLLIGVTGTIASGKTTVANMLANLGAYTIDFDLIAREVVEPGAIAYQQIVDYFGKHILQENGKLDRKKLSDIVFCDPEKRKILENYTHPQIALTFISQLEKINQKNPHAIIQAIVPLMIEQNLQNLFHKVLLVYIPQKELAGRLMRRNSIDQEEAMRIINSQIPIDEKVKYADFVIDNGKDLANTNKQVDELWLELLNCSSLVRIQKSNG
ncbi:dephospho-CoA kinase [Candidatus Magnetomorum sp. HK-1]|nr:dephospho-CoA kinase [Candidatus Magnetomorum sp. HK-1]